MSDIADAGAIGWLLLATPDKATSGELVPPLLDLVDRRLIRILDALIIIKGVGDDVDVLTTDDVDPDRVGDLRDLAGASSGLLGRQHAAEAAAVLEPHTVALLIVYENLWSIPVAVAARKAGGQLIALGNVPSAVRSRVPRRQANRWARHDQSAYYRAPASDDDDQPLRRDQPDLLGPGDGLAARAHAELSIHRAHL